MPVWLVRAATSTASIQEFPQPVFPVMQNLFIMPVYLAPIVSAVITPATGLLLTQVHTPVLLTKAGMVLITVIHPVVLVIPLHLAAPLALPAMMGMKAMMMVEMAVEAMMIEILRYTS